jgi:hypothetical protein
MVIVVSMNDDSNLRQANSLLLFITSSQAGLKPQLACWLFHNFRGCAALNTCTMKIIMRAVICIILTGGGYESSRAAAPAV